MTHDSTMKCCSKNMAGDSVKMKMQKK
jgi:hypothetical protein